MSNIILIVAFRSHGFLLAVTNVLLVTSLALFQLLHPVDTVLLLLLPVDAVLSLPSVTLFQYLSFSLHSSSNRGKHSPFSQAISWSRPWVDPRRSQWIISSIHTDTLCCLDVKPIIVHGTSTPSVEDHTASIFQQGSLHSQWTVQTNTVSQW